MKNTDSSLVHDITEQLKKKVRKINGQKWNLSETNADTMGKKHLNITLLIRRPEWRVSGVQ